MSSARNLVGSLPIASTRPTISWPGTSGKSGGPQPPWADGCRYTEHRSAGLLRRICRGTMGVVVLLTPYRRAPLRCSCSSSPAQRRREGCYQRARCHAGAGKLTSFGSRLNLFGRMAETRHYQKTCRGHSGRLIKGCDTSSCHSTCHRLDHEDVRDGPQSIVGHRPVGRGVTWASQGNERCTHVQATKKPMKSWACLKILVAIGGLEPPTPSL